MTDKKQAKDLVDLNASDEQIVRLTGCHPECVDALRAWGRGERIQIDRLHNGGWVDLHERENVKFARLCSYRIAPRRIHATATLEDGRVVEVEFPAPVREPLEYGEEYYRAYCDMDPAKLTWEDLNIERKWLRQGRIFRTREDALEHDRAMIRLRGGEVE